MHAKYYHGLAGLKQECVNIVYLKNTGNTRGAMDTEKGKTLRSTGL